MDLAYKDIIKKIIEEIKQSSGGTLGIDGATENLSNQTLKEKRLQM